LTGTGRLEQRWTARGTQLLAVELDARCAARQPELDMGTRRSLHADVVRSTDEADRDHTRRPAQRQSALGDTAGHLERPQVDGTELALELVGTADDLDVPRHACVEGNVGAALAPVPLQAALVLDRHGAVTQPDLGHRTVELRAVEVLEVG